MDRRLPLVAAALAAATLLSGCALQARTDSDPHASLAQCRNYGFAPTVSEKAEGAFANPLNDKRLRDAIAEQLRSRGATVVEGEGADCLVRYAIGSRSGVEAGAPRATWSFGWGWGWGHRGYGGLGYDVPYDTREGRVSVDLVDARTRDALWHAYVAADVTNLTGDAAEKRIREAVAAIFARFPLAVAAGAGGSRS